MADEGISFTVDGLDELIDSLGNAGDVIKDAITDQLEQLRDDIEQQTTALCPVDTGALLDSIDISVSDFTLTAIAGMDYASYVDQGTRYMDAQPFFEDPINDLVDDFADQLEEAIASSLENT